jgi:EAL domain-containing protein (putative c-di-GMP-specific phosphodiesterase class I)
MIGDIAQDIARFLVQPLFGGEDKGLVGLPDLIAGKDERRDGQISPMTLITVSAVTNCPVF